MRAYNNNTYLTELVAPEVLENVVVVVCPLQPSSSANPGCPGPESSVPVSSCLVCPISSQVTDHWGCCCSPWVLVSLSLGFPPRDN